MDWSYFQIFCDISGVVTLAVKDPPANAGDVRTMDTVPGSGRSSGVGNGNPLPLFLSGKFHGQRSLAG